MEEKEELLKLKEKAYKTREKFSEASKDLRGIYFHEIDSEVENIENKIKKEFLDIVNKEIKDSLIEFKFHYDPFNITMSAKIKIMKIGGTNYDLDLIASNYPENKRTHDTLLTISKDYREEREGIEDRLIDLGLHPSARPCKIEKIEDFLNKNNIFGFVPEFY
jgi:hypothetical protein